MPQASKRKTLDKKSESRPASFDDVPTIGAMGPAQAARKLREIGEDEVAVALEGANARRQESWPFQDKPWQHTEHTFGYLAPADPGTGLLPFQHAGSIKPDDTLKNGRISIKLDRLRVVDYPGKGTHQILFDFAAQNQVPGKAEDLHFDSTYRAREGQSAAIIGYPIFIGLNVGSQGVSFRCSTVNVKNEEDERLLGFLDSDTFKQGLRLISTVQPAIAPLSEMAMGLTRGLLNRSKNVKVQEFHLGLDFTRIATGARLAEGSYFAVQIPRAEAAKWDWTKWAYNQARGQVVDRSNPDYTIPYNYVTLGVSRYEDDGV